MMVPAAAIPNAANERRLRRSGSVRELRLVRDIEVDNQAARERDSQ
jgi:hypothetical protein